MIWFLIPFAAIGAGLVALVACLLIQEIVRAARQAGRVAAVSVRASGERRKPTQREWRFAFRREFWSAYHTIRIGIFEIPHNPSKPIRAAF